MREYFKKKNKANFMPFYIAGYPNKEESIQNIQILEEFGDILEIGIPFSDPSADGEVIRNASQIAIQNGFNTKDVFDIIKTINTKKPIVILCYLNTIMQYGIHKFMQEASIVGIKTILCPDLPPEHRNILAQDASLYGIDIAHIISTNTPIDRVIFIDKLVNSFIYLTSRPSITGMQNDIPNETLEYINKIRPMIQNPLYIGFGISTRQHIETISKTKLDGFIIGSKIISLNSCEIKQYLQNTII